MLTEYFKNTFRDIKEYIILLSQHTDYNYLNNFFNKNFPKKYGQQAILLKMLTDNPQLEKELVAKSISILKKKNDFYIVIEACLCLLVFEQYEFVTNYLSAKKTNKGELLKEQKELVSYVFSLSQSAEDIEYLSHFIRIDKIVFELIKSFFLNGHDRGVEYIINYDKLNINTAIIDDEGIFEQMIKRYLGLIVFESDINDEKIHSYSKIIYGLIKTLDYVTYERQLSEILNKKEFYNEKYPGFESRFIENLKVIYKALCSKMNLEKAKLLQSAFDIKDDDYTLSKKIEAVFDRNEWKTLLLSAPKNNLGTKTYVEIAKKVNSPEDFFRLFPELKKTKDFDVNVFITLITRCSNLQDYKILFNNVDEKVFEEFEDKRNIIDNKILYESLFKVGNKREVIEYILVFFCEHGGFVEEIVKALLCTFSI